MGLVTCHYEMRPSHYNAFLISNSLIISHLFFYLNYPNYYPCSERVQDLLLLFPLVVFLSATAGGRLFVADGHNEDDNEQQLPGGVRLAVVFLIVRLSRGMLQL